MNDKITIPTAEWIGKLRKLRKPRCKHSWQITGPTGTGWYLGECALCGEKALFS